MLQALEPTTIFHIVNALLLIERRGRYTLLRDIRLEMTASLRHFVVDIAEKAFHLTRNW